MRRALVPVSVVALLLLAACSGRGNESASDPSGSEIDRPRAENTAPIPDQEPERTPQEQVGEPSASADAEAAAAVAVVRAWSTALNAGDNEAAAKLFAPDAVVIQSSSAFPLVDMDAAVLFNASLPCSGLLIDVAVTGNVVTAVFELGDRQSSSCDAPPGTLAAADFLIEGGSILAWRIVPVPNSSDGSSSAT